MMLVFENGRKAGGNWEEAGRERCTLQSDTAASSPQRVDRLRLVLVAATRY